MVCRIGAMWLVLALTAHLGVQVAPSQEAPTPVLTVHVVDEAGNPVPNATVGLYGLHDVGGRKGHTRVSEPAWLKTDADGRVAFPPLSNHAHREFAEEAKEWLLLVSAPNYLPVREILAPATVKGRMHTVRLKRGRPMEIWVRNETGKSLPEPLNLGLFELREDHTPAFEYMETQYEFTEARGSEMVKFQIHSQFGLEPLGEGRYRCSLPEDYNRPLIAIVHQPGFLRGFYTRIEPEAVRQGRAELRLPKPATLIVEVDVSRAPQDAYEQFSLQVKAIVEPGNGSRPFVYSLLDERIEGQRTVTLDDLAPESYGVLLEGIPRMLGLDREKQDFKWAAERFVKHIRCEKLTPDAPRRIQLTYAPPDLSQYRGNQQFTITVTMPDGTPAANQPYTLKVWDDSGRELTVLEGTLDSAGRATLTQLRERVFYYLYVANRSEVAGALYLGDDLRPQPTHFQVPPCVGDPAPNVTLRAVEGNATKQLSDYKGKWVYLDFWATWCGPCRTALEQLKAELPALKERYKDSLVVITVSIDDLPDPVKPYLEKLGLWGQCEHFWAGPGGWQSPVGQAFVVYGVPTAFVINPDGIIVWRGHPMSLNLPKILGSGR